MRARNLKPGFFQNEQLAELPLEARLLFLGLTLIADREGRLEDRPRRIKMLIFPADSLEVEPLLDGLASQELIVRYHVDGNAYIWIPTFTKHQKPHPREVASAIPPYQDDAQSRPRQDQGKTKALLSPAESLNPSSLNAESLNGDSCALTGAVEQSPTKPGKSEAVQRVFDHWKTTWNHPRAKIDAKRRKAILAALKTYDESDLCQAITGYQNSPHHCGQNDRETVYDSIELLLRDAKHIDAGIKFYETPPSGHSSITRGNIDRTKDWRPPEMRKGDAES